MTDGPAILRIDSNASDRTLSMLLYVLLPRAPARAADSGQKLRRAL